MSDFNKISRTDLPDLPENFWTLCSYVSNAWDRMNTLLDHEWTALKTHEINDLVKLAKAKQTLAEQIEEREKRLFDTVTSLIAACGIRNPKNRWGVFRRLITSDDLKRLNHWKWRYDASKNRAVAVNRRLYKWINEQMVLSSELSAILAGRMDEDNAFTYSRDRMQKKRARHVPYRSAMNRMLTSIPAKTAVRSGVSFYRELQKADIVT